VKIEIKDPKFDEEIYRVVFRACAIYGLPFAIWINKNMDRFYDEYLKEKRLPPNNYKQQIKKGLK